MTRSPTSAQRPAGRRRVGVVHVEQALRAEQARHPPCVAPEPLEERRVEADLAEPLEQDQGEGAGHAPQLAATPLDRLEVAELLVEHAAEDDACHAHRACPGERLGRRARAADHDLARLGHVDRRRTQLLGRLVDPDHQLAVDRLPDAGDAVQQRAGDLDADAAPLDRLHPARDMADHRLLVAERRDQQRAVDA